MSSTYQGGAMPGGGGAAPSLASTATKSEAVTPALGLTGNPNDLNTVGPTGAISTQPQNITVTAIVSETEITNTQDRVARMSSSAEL
jgi:hypothetical protein